MLQVLFILQIILAIVLTIIILLQKSSSIGLGAYSGSNESLFGAKGPQGFLAKLTFILGTLFIINTIALGYMYNKEHNKSLIDEVKVKEEKKIIPEVPIKKETNEVPAAPKNK
ncbi:preprotein translocase subunit SecG [Nitrosophilus kaiyonis]|uniref:preprotein translocase subunit SecG n=1 Tax=Nitrosophilus kaiyonis TaxID=2930200 RepID=UPI00248FA530|nr:preprotein translocase subunit SecG [Nitrosophilus kaiyonis]